MAEKTGKRSHRPKEVRLFFPATLENVDKAAKEIDGVLHSIGIKKESFPILLGMREALLNAVSHGSGRDGRKKVQLKLKLRRDHILMEITDEGEGFDWKSRLEKGLQARKESGRGFAIIKRCFTDIEYNEKGNGLILKRKLIKPPISKE